MDHAQDDHLGAGDAEDGAIRAVDQMTLGCAKDFVFGDAGAAFGKSLRRGDLLFECENEGFSIGGAVLGDVVPDLPNVGLCGRSDLNDEVCGHV